MVNKKDEKLFGIFTCSHSQWPWYYQRGGAYDSLLFRRFGPDTLERIQQNRVAGSIATPDKFLLPLEFLE